MQVAEISMFTDVLRASGRSPEIPEAADAYGWLVGSWELDCRRYAGEPVSIQGVDISGPFGKRLGRGQDEEHVWDHTTRVGFFHPSLENQLAESRS